MTGQGRLDWRQAVQILLRLRQVIRLVAIRCLDLDILWLIADWMVSSVSIWRGVMYPSLSYWLRMPFTVQMAPGFTKSKWFAKKAVCFRIFSVKETLSGWKLVQLGIKN